MKGKRIEETKLNVAEDGLVIDSFVNASNKL